MIRNILSLVLLIVSVGLSFKHGWDTLHYRQHPESMRMMKELGIGEAAVPYVAGLTILTGILLLIPRTFFAGNVLNAVTILLVMALSLRSGNYRTALIEIPFLAMPLILIWLKYPFKH